ncbi:hypothetical protein E2P64_08545 [Candidatus Bathyarchaeota archaeon]|nr:hypothetical protein E2P64_08545 [Candidatus Bathyarchaeota archaeon]
MLLKTRVLVLSGHTHLDHFDPYCQPGIGSDRLIGNQLEFGAWNVDQCQKPRHNTTKTPKVINSAFLSFFILVSLKSISTQVD